MRAILLGALLCACACGEPEPSDPLVCEGDRCAYLAPGVGVTFRRASVPGAPGGDWIAVEGGPALLVFSPDGDAPLEIHGVRVDGADVFDASAASAGVEPALDVRPTGSPPTLIVPRGEIEVLLRAPGPTEITVARFARAAPGRVLAVDVRVFDPEVDRDEIARALDEASALVGIELDVTFVAVLEGERDEALATGYALATLASLARRRRAGVDLFLVPSLDAGVIGRTSSTPLSPLRGESAVAIDGGLARPLLGRTIAHELGHALGLLHVSEEDGWQLEALADTPTCLADANGDRRVDAADCPDASANLMFWDASGRGVELSAMQRARLSSSPLLR